jgi:hypothetical protein
MLGCAQKQVNVGDEPINSWIVGHSYLGIYFRIARNPSAIGCKLQVELPTSRKGAAETQGEYPISAIRHWLHEPAGKPCRQLRFNSTGFPASAR